MDHPAYPVESRRVDKISRDLRAFVTEALQPKTLREALRSGDQVKLELARRRQAQARELYRENALEVPVVGRLDLREHEGAPVETLYVGKRSAGPDPEEGFRVVDWRTSVGALLYQADCGPATYRNDRNEEQQAVLLLRRKLGVAAGRLEDITDEDVLPEYSPEEGRSDLGLIADEYLIQLLSAGAGTRLREIIGTIQREQHRFVREPRDQPLILQAVAGGGKSTVALHRLAQVLFDVRQETGSAGRVCVFAPNRVLVQYVAGLLPSLLEFDVPHLTFREWAVQTLFKGTGGPGGGTAGAAPAIRRSDSPGGQAGRAIALKGSLAFRTALERYLQLISENRLPRRDVAIGSRITCPPEQIREWYEQAGHLPYSQRWALVTDRLEQWARAQLPGLAAEVTGAWTQVHDRVSAIFPESPGRTRLLETVHEHRLKVTAELSGAITRYVQDRLGAAWKRFDLLDLYVNLVTEPELLARVLDTTPAEIGWFCRANEYLRRKRELDEADLAPLLYLHALIEGVPPAEKWLHVVVDEGQDWSPLQYAVLNAWVEGESVTIVGDLAQGLAGPYGLSDWNALRGGVFTADRLKVQEFNRSYRLTKQTLELACRVLRAAKIPAPALEAIRDGAAPTVRHYGRLPDAEQAVLHYALEHAGEDRTVGIVAPSTAAARQWAQRLEAAGLPVHLIDEDAQYSGGISVLPVHLAKGLELDHAAVVDADSEHYPPTPEAARRLYVAITRARQHVFVVAVGQLSRLLRT